MTPQDIIARCERVFNSEERRNAANTWELLAEFIMPNQSGIFQGSDGKGTKKTTRLFDSTAPQANHDLASSIHASLTNPAVRWSKLRFKDDRLNNDREAIEWLEAANAFIHNALTESNFHMEVAKDYQFLTALGNMALLHEEDDSDDGMPFGGFRFTAMHLSTLAWEENRRGQVDSVYRKFKMTARQAVERFGAKVSREIKEAVEAAPNQEFEFVHAIFPRAKKDVKRGTAKPANRPFGSLYVEMKTQELLEEGGYYEFPIYVVRWETLAGEQYGRGVGHIALPDIRTLNKTKELILESATRAVKPSLLATQRSVISDLDLRPGKISVVRDLDGIKEFQTAARFDVSQLVVEDLRQAIKSIFFIDKIFLPARPETKTEMTAYEVAQRAEQMNKVLGATMGRLNKELLEPLIIRSFKMLLRSGALPDMPASLKESGVNIDIVFVNSLARSQVMEDVSSIQAWVQDLAMLAQLNPSVIDYINMDAIAKHTAKIRGVPESAVQDDDAVQEIRESRSEQQQAMMELEAGVKAADIQAKSAKAGRT